jgi:hypothetical protein
MGLNLNFLYQKFIKNWLDSSKFLHFSLKISKHLSKKFLGSFDRIRPKFNHQIFTANWIFFCPFWAFWPEIRPSGNTDKHGMLAQLGVFWKNALYKKNYFVANNTLCQSSDLLNHFVGLQKWKTNSKDMRIGIRCYLPQNSFLQCIFKKYT